MRKDAFFETLWNRMAQQGDFPTLQYSVDNIFKTLHSDLNVGQMASSVLSDFSLSQKVIRLANSAMYRSFGGEVTTVSRAILVLGVEAISHLTLGVQLLDYFHGVAPSRPQAARAMTQALVAGEITRALSNARGINEGEEAVVCTLMYHMSRLLLVFYFPDEWERIQALTDSGEMAETDACVEVVGVSLAEIAEAAAVKWRLPGLIANTMSHRPVTAETVIETHTDWLGAMAQVSSQAAAAMTRDAAPEDVEALLSEHARVLGLDAADIRFAIRQAGTLSASIAQAEAPDTEAPAPEGKPADAIERLRVGLEEVRREGAALSIGQMAPLALECVMRALNFENGFLMVLNPGAKRFDARLGFGNGVREKLDALSFEEGFVPDIFHFATISPRPLQFEDTHDAEVAQRVPRWYRDAMPEARSVLLAPVKLRNRCVALLCGDWGATCCAGGLTEAELELVGEFAKEIGASFLRSAAA
ncbi:MULTISPECIES: HDOD domain-containing protein [unclassified Cupriavidus]|uniref:HDOD domain-containing protein n=1 Tax=unclassified Cupriavidus TaxID=2640874 RepID=UPI00313AEC0C